MRGERAVIGIACAAALAAVVAPGCSLGAGTGTCAGTLDVPDCWSGQFDLHPDFFAAIPGDKPQYPASSTGTMIIRIQHGSDYETFSDGLAILIDDVGAVRGDPAADGTPRASLLHQPLVVSLSPDVVPPGVPVSSIPDPSIVHATLYLDATCRTQDEALYAMSAVSGVDTDGECRRPEGGEPALDCPGAPVESDGGVIASGGDAGLGAEAGLDAGGAADATLDGGASGAGGDGGDAASTPTPGSGSIGTSTITFDDLFDNNPVESNASQRLSQGSFEFYLADPRDICPGGQGPPPRCEGHLKGTFKFYFQRGIPAQPFP
ncbi:MAG TPA: hypothetical protein VGG39_30665 [Polyangiaceae bacterium]